MLETKQEGEVIYKTMEPKESKKFPGIVILIVFNEFCERFSYSGMRAFLALYLRHKLSYSDDEATEVYHIFSTMAYFFPIFGAILADSFYGKFKTILYLMIVYIIGNLILAITAIPPLGIPGREFTILGLVLVSVGTGGIKPCVSAFGGDQFKLPEQEKQLTTFFSFFYLIICFGSLIAKTVSPLLRSEIHCFGDKDCYSVAFGAPVVLIFISIVLYIWAKKLYIIKKPTSNIVLDFIKCVTKAIRNRIGSKSSEKKESHWLDYARDSYDDNLIRDIKQTLGLFLLFTPLPVFWSLLDQLGSRWTLQASRMDGKFSFFTVKPDQMQVLCPVLIVIFIPLFKKIVYPFLAKYGLLCKSLHKLIAGCVFAGISFICSGMLEWHLESTYPILPSEGLGQLRIFNGYNCDMEYNHITRGESFKIEALGYYENKLINVEKIRTLIYNKTIGCPTQTKTFVEGLHIIENEAITYFYNDNQNIENNRAIRYEDKVQKSRSGFPYIRILASEYNANLNISLYNTQRELFEVITNSTRSELYEVFSGEYELYINSKLIPIKIDLNIGGVYTLLIGNNGTNFNPRLITITEPNSVTMAWVLPQLILMSAAEVLFSVTGLEFAYTEAPESMKSVLQAYWYFIEALGNVIIIVVTRLASNYRQVTQYFFYATMIFFSTIIFHALMKRHERQKERNKQNGTPINYELVHQNDKLENQK